MKGFKRYFLALLFLLSGLNQVISQVPVEKSINKVILEGKVYYIHLVKPGQTLYSISRAYEISENEIITENPGVDRSMPAGIALKIPATSKAGKSIPQPQPETEKQILLQHTIVKGETLYSLSKRYSTTVEEIEKVNPGISYNDLPVGQKIYVPKPTVSVQQQEYIYHKVKRRETIYGISKFYKITEEQLKIHNPELRNSYPRKGQTLRIPKISEPLITVIEETKPQVFVDSTFLKPQTVADSFDVTKSNILVDSLVQKSLFRDTIIKASLDYYKDSLPDISGRPINVAFLIPFNYSVTQEIEIQDSLTEKEADGHEKEKEFVEILPENVNLLEFMQGSLLAIDHLRKKGISVNVKIFDTKRSSDRVKEIINSPDFDKTDIIIGPFYSFNVEVVSEFSMQHHIPVVSPFYNGSELTEKNPFLFQANPSLITEYNQIADYLSDIKQKNIIYIHTTDSLGVKKFNYLRSQILEGLELKGNLSSNQFTEIIYDNIKKTDFLRELTVTFSKEKENLVVIPEIDEVFVKAIVTHLFFQQKKFSVRVIGMPDWITFQFQSEDYIYLHKLELSYFTPYYYTYDSTDIKQFLKEYTREFFTEPVNLTSKGCPYGYIGYDLSYYFLSSLGKYGRQFFLHLRDDSQGGQLLNDFRFEKINDSGGFENQALMLIKLMPDMSISAYPTGIPFMIKNQVSRENLLKE